MNTNLDNMTCSFQMWELQKAQLTINKCITKYLWGIDPCIDLVAAWKPWEPYVLKVLTAETWI